MNITSYFKKFTILSLFLFQAAAFSFAQTANLPAPREQKLLNGLKLLVWSNPNAEKASVKLRIHSGAAFDPLAKEGVMALLGEILFPNQTVMEYFSEDLGGSLSVESNYDYIQIEATGDNDKILEILEALANAVTKPQIDKDTTAKVKAENLEKLKELEKNPSYIADQAVAKRLFGNYPYGRPPLGTSETVSKLDFADILLAKQKFLTADNATLAISGNVKFEYAHRAARRLFGGWEKADKKIPATFTQPDTPDEKPFTINIPSAAEETYYAMNGFARNDKDFYTAQILTKIFARQFPSAQMLHKSYLLKGIISSKPITGSNNAASASSQSNEYRQIKQEDFNRAKAEILAELNQKNPADFWFDIDTYKLVSVKEEIQKAGNTSFEDALRTLDRIMTQPKVTVVIQKTQETNSTIK